MRWLAGGGLAGGFICLVLAATLGPAGWRYALVGVMVGISVFACGALGAIVERFVPPARRAALAGLVTGVAARTRQTNPPASPPPASQRMG